uniref:Uncharacterized protein n=1 Tax=Anguilla anguilla TaxID=7936 RepID=A0A0E9UMZ4_ANGAN
MGASAQLSCRALH